MEIQIRPLTPEMADIFTTYVGELDFHHAPHWQFCNCQYYHINCPTEEWRARSAEQNRQLAQENIRNGVMHGFMAFDGDKPIGWINANDQQNYDLLKNNEEFKQYPGKNGLVVCFLIHPEYRRKRLARKLLETAVEDFRTRGYDRVIGKPFTWSAHPERQYHGVPIMYEELSFVKMAEKNGEFTYVLELK